MSERGQRLGRYRLEELLGQGGMAEVWRATDEKLDRAVAVKVILAAHARDPHFRERFEREAKLVASLDHPNVLPVYDYGDEEGVPWLVMPFLDGGTLRDRMAEGPVPFARAVSWVRQLGGALDAAHAAGILHRDVKPANVLVRRDGRLALADFGIAKMLEVTTGLTATGMVVGTPVYMAPEQAQGKPATPASDRYALAVLAYELLSGRPPFDGESALALMHQHVTSPAPPLSSSVLGLPAGLDPVFERALSKDPERRPRSCRELADALVAFVPTGADLDAEAPTSPWSAADRTSPTVYEPTPKRLAERSPRGAAELTSEPTISTAPRPSRRALLAAAAGGAAIVLLVGAWLLAPRLRPVPGEAQATAVPVAPAAPAAAPAAEPAEAGEATAGSVRVVDLPVPAAAAPTLPETPAVAAMPAIAAPRGEAVDGRPGLPPGVRGESDLRASRAKLDPALRGGVRPSRSDFEEALRAARAALETDPARPTARALEHYAAGGIAYLDRRDAEAVRSLLAAEAEGGRIGAWDFRLGRAVAGRLSGGSGVVGWELALAYGDARREAESLLAADLARERDPRALLGRAALHRLDGRGEEAIADAGAVWESRPPGFLGAAAAELVADEHSARARWEDAAAWYRKAAIPQSPSSSRAGWEGARILADRLGRPDEARELFDAACRAGNRKACLESGGEPPPPRRPRPFARRRGP